MKSSKSFAAAAVAVLSAALCTVAVGQDHATAQEVVAKVREAASTLSKGGDLAQFNQKQGPWVWKDTYIFVHDCDKKVVAAHPTRPEQVGQDITNRHHQADVRKPVRVGLAKVLPIITGQPGTQGQQSGAKWQKVRGVQPVKQGTGQGEQRKTSNAARPFLVRARVEFLEGEAQEEAEGDQQQQSQDGGRLGHFAVLYQ